MRPNRREELGGSTAVRDPSGRPPTPPPEAGLPAQRGRGRKSLTYGDVMSRDLVVVPSWLPVGHPQGRPARPCGAVYPVVDAAGALVGLLDPAAVRPDAPDAGHAAVVADIPVVSVDEPVRLRVRGGHGRTTLALVVDNGRLVGLVTPGCLRRR